MYYWGIAGPCLTVSWQSTSHTEPDSVTSNLLETYEEINNLFNYRNGRWGLWKEKDGMPWRDDQSRKTIHWSQRPVCTIFLLGVQAGNAETLL